MVRHTVERDLIKHRPLCREGPSSDGRRWSAAARALEALKDDKAWHVNRMKGLLAGQALELLWVDEGGAFFKACTPATQRRNTRWY
jgi:hypothetical protein